MVYAMLSRFDRKKRNWLSNKRPVKLRCDASNPCDILQSVALLLD
jgi:hypothetical protein